MLHWVKSVQIQGYLWSVSSCIQSEYRKIRTRYDSVFGHFSRSVIAEVRLIFATFFISGIVKKEIMHFTNTNANKKKICVPKWLSQVGE